jgi:hypothetical protein
MIRSPVFTVLVDSESPATDLQGKPLLSRERGADRLAVALRAFGHDVTSQESPLAAATPGRWLLYFGGDPTEALARCGPRRRATEARLIIMDEDRVSAGEFMDKLRVPLVVTSRSYRNWLRNMGAWAEVFGRTATARALGIALSPQDAMQHHAQFVIPDVPLPGGIARYCAASELTTEPR